jgi:Holliday junction resolvase RusA-like endonuclease
MAEPTRIAFTIYGKPETQGSKRSFVVRKKSGAIATTPDGRPIVRTVEHRKEQLAAWRQDVARTARAAYDGKLLDGPLNVEMVFYRPRPKGHYGTGRNAGKLKSSAPLYPTGRPDRLKLARAVEDALTGVLWRDDSQGVEGIVCKRWGEPARVEVVVESLEGIEPSQPTRSAT